MAKKSIALGSIVEIDFAGGTTYVPILAVTGFSPPGRPGTEADGKVLGDTLDIPIPGIEGPAEFNFIQFYEPGDAEDILIQTAYDNRREPAGASGGVLGVRVLYPHNGVEIGDTMPAQTFQINLLNLGPEEVSEPNSTFKRAVQGRRITDIVTTTFLVPTP